MRYSVSLRIQFECRKIQTRKNSVFGHFSRSDKCFKTSSTNKRGTQVLSNMFTEAISNVTNLQFVLHSVASDNRIKIYTDDYDKNKA